MLGTTSERSSINLHGGPVITKMHDQLEILNPLDARCILQPLK